MDPFSKIVIKKFIPFGLLIRQKGTNLYGYLQLTAHFYKQIACHNPLWQGSHGFVALNTKHGVLNKRHITHFSSLNKIINTVQLFRWNVGRVFSLAYLGNSQKISSHYKALFPRSGVTAIKLNWSATALAVAINNGL